MEQAGPPGPTYDEVWYAIHSDHLGTPQFITDATETMVWSQSHSAFGEAAPNEDPDGDSTTFTYNQRFPGQYFDQESGLHYNYFRDYDPTTGRYIESDPIGLLGGLNTYGYVSGNPINDLDILGLAGQDIAQWLPPGWCLSDKNGVLTVGPCPLEKECFSDNGNNDSGSSGNDPESGAGNRTGNGTGSDSKEGGSTGNGENYAKNGGTSITSYCGKYGLYCERSPLNKCLSGVVKNSLPSIGREAVGHSINKRMSGRVRHYGHIILKGAGWYTWGLGIGGGSLGCLANN